MPPFLIHVSTTSNVASKYRGAPISTDSVSMVSVIRGLPQPEQKFEN
jgi:hypothetical protein